jgi:hypothetical protein
MNTEPDNKKNITQALVNEHRLILRGDHPVGAERPVNSGRHVL